MSTTPNMLLSVPTVGVTGGTAYASEINNSLTIIDGHNHTSGSGVPIPVSGLNINGTLPFNNQLLTNAQAINFTTQVSNAAVNSLFFKGVDLYATDGNGNVIQMTTGGGVNATIGTLSSGAATAAFVASVLTVKSTASLAADVDGGSFIFRNTSPNSTFGVTLSAPSTLASNWSLFLPSIPAQTNVMTLDSSGNMGSTTYAALGAQATLAQAVGVAMNSTGANAIAGTITTSGANTIAATMNPTGANQIATTMTSTGANAIAATRTRTCSQPGPAAVGDFVLSLTSGSFITSSTNYVSVTNLSATLTTSGRPIMMILTPDGVNPGSIASQAVSPRVAFFEGATNIAEFQLSGIPNAANFIALPGSIAFIYNVVAGTHTITVKAKSDGSNVIAVSNCIIWMYEL